MLIVKNRIRRRILIISFFWRNFLIGKLIGTLRNWKKGGVLSHFKRAFWITLLETTSFLEKVLFITPKPVDNPTVSLEVDKDGRYFIKHN